MGINSVPFNQDMPKSKISLSKETIITNQSSDPHLSITVEHLPISPSSTFFLRPGGWSQIVELMLRNLWLQNDGLLTAGRLHQNPDLVCQTFLPIWRNWLWGLSWTWAYHFHVCLIDLREHWCIRSGEVGGWVMCVTDVRCKHHDWFPRFR